MSGKNSSRSVSTVFELVLESVMKVLIGLMPAMIRRVHLRVSG